MSDDIEQVIGNCYNLKDLRMALKPFSDDCQVHGVNGERMVVSCLVIGNDVSIRIEEEKQD